MMVIVKDLVLVLVTMLEEKMLKVAVERVLECWKEEKGLVELV